MFPLSLASTAVGYLETGWFLKGFLGSIFGFEWERGARGFYKPNIVHFVGGSLLRRSPRTVSSQATRFDGVKREKGSRKP